MLLTLCTNRRFDGFSRLEKVNYSAKRLQLIEFTYKYRTAVLQISRVTDRTINLYEEKSFRNGTYVFFSSSGLAMQTPTKQANKTMDTFILLKVTTTRTLSDNKRLVTKKGDGLRLELNNSMSQTSYMQAHLIYTLEEL